MFRADRARGGDVLDRVLGGEEGAAELLMGSSLDWVCLI